jgi:hypothetical protein
MKNYAITALLVLLTATGLYAVTQQRRAASAERERRVVALERDRTEALADSTRMELLDAQNGMVAYRRRAFQAELERDSLDERWQEESRVRAQLTAEVARLRTSVEGETVTDSADVRLAGFQFYRRPFHVTANITVPPPPDPPVGEFDILLDEIKLGLRIACGEPRYGIRPATVSISAEEWVRLTVDGIQQEAEVCNPEAPEPVAGPSRLRWLLAGGVLTAIVLEVVR